MWILLKKWKSYKMFKKIHFLRWKFQETDFSISTLIIWLNKAYCLKIAAALFAIYGQNSEIIINMKTELWSSLPCRPLSPVSPIYLHNETFNNLKLQMTYTAHSKMIWNQNTVCLKENIQFRMLYIYEMTNFLCEKDMSLDNYRLRWTG